jgi:hypothetical protein
MSPCRPRAPRCGRRLSTPPRRISSPKKPSYSDNSVEAPPQVEGFVEKGRERGVAAQRGRTQRTAPNPNGTHDRAERKQPRWQRRQHYRKDRWLEGKRTCLTNAGHAGIIDVNAYTTHTHTHTHTHTPHTHTCETHTCTRTQTFTLILEKPVIPVEQKPTTDWRTLNATPASTGTHMQPPYVAAPTAHSACAARCIAYGRGSGPGPGNRPARSPHAQHAWSCHPAAAAVAQRQTRRGQQQGARRAQKNQPFT